MFVQWGLEGKGREGQCFNFQFATKSDKMILKKNNA